MEQLRRWLAELLGGDLDGEMILISPAFCAAYRGCADGTTGRCLCE
jgi:hypothetical protein